MDELIFRAEQALELLQVQLRLVMENSLRLIQQYTNEGRQLALRAVNESNVNAIKTTANNFWLSVLRAAQKIKDVCSELSNPELLYEQLRVLLRDEICRNNVFFICIGLGFGTTGGILLGMWIARPKLAAPVMKSIACLSIDGPDNVTLCHSSIPILINPTDILIRVRAVSLNRLDEQISNGYGRNLRRMIKNYNHSYNTELPLVIGRACAGIVEGVGRNSKSGLEIGDEVWLASPWYETGLASEFTVVPESRVGRKPFIIGFEGAASLPYSGCIALAALRTAGLNEHNCLGKRILIQDGCSPVGCVLTQLTKKWGAFVTSTCHLRSVPVIKALGADDVIAFHSENDDEDEEPLFEEQNILFKELSIRKEYNFVFFTTSTHYDKEFIRSFVSPKGIIVDTVEQPLSSDNYGVLKIMFYSMFVRLKKLGAKFINLNPDWGGPHVCHLTLDTLSGYVNDGILQTVVDQVYIPQDAEHAIVHVRSSKSIGSTIVTFRS